ncbi:MAG: MFS transporter, partial [Acidimicrobiales bacterium]|nr:MFS transporter [Acidimicrobiales bacterium]
PNGLRLAVVRDLFDGDRMARVVTFATAVFLIGPVVMPIFGTALLALGPWPVIPLAGVVLAMAGALGVAWFGETLPVHRRTPRRRGSTLAGIALVVRTPAAIGGIATSTLFGAAFFVFLGSAQPVIDRTFGAGDRFIWFFAGSGISMAVALLANARLVRAVGARRTARVASSLYLVVGAVALVPVAAAGGRPSIWVWYAWVCATNAIGMVVNANASALALDPVGRVAGVASSLLAFCQLGIGSLLAAVVDAQLDGTVTPMVVGSLVFGATGWTLLRWATAAPTMAPSSTREAPAP